MLSFYFSKKKTKNKVVLLIIISRLIGEIRLASGCFRGSFSGWSPSRAPGRTHISYLAPSSHKRGCWLPWTTTVSRARGLFFLPSCPILMAMDKTGSGKSRSAGEVLSFRLRLWVCLVPSFEILNRIFLYLKYHIKYRLIKKLITELVCKLRDKSNELN